MTATRLTAIVLFAISAAWQTPRDTVPQPKGTAVLTGTVLDTNGVPLAGASVTVTDRYLRLRQITRTDAAGRFAIKALPAESYRVLATLRGFAATAFGARNGDAGVAIVLADAEHFDATITLPRVSVVSGTIVDEYGAPAVATVSFLARRANPRGAQIAEVARIDSNRQGRYRLEGLRAGNYYVRAERPSATADVRRMDHDAIAAARLLIDQPGSPMPSRNASSDVTLSYLPVYYPGVATSTAATLVRVEPGIERANIDLQLQVIRTTAIEGSLADPSGQPLANATTRLIGDDEALERYGSTTADGRFQFVGVPAGRYVLTARSPLPVIPSQKRTVLWGSQELVVNPGEPVTPALSFHAGADISGTVVFDGTADVPDFARVSATVAQLIPLSGPFTRFTMPSALVSIQHADELKARSIPIRFESVPPGRYMIVPSTQLSGGWAVQSAMLAGADVSLVPVDVAAGQHLTGLVVTFAKAPDPHSPQGITTLSGTVKNEISEPVFAHTLVVFPADRRAWLSGSSGRIRAIRPDSRGKYEIRGLQPGEYLIALASDVNPAEIVLPEMLGSLEPGAVRVRLVEGQATIQDLQTRAVR